jgi:signal peptidase
MTPALERGDVLVSEPSRGVGLGRGTIAVFRTDTGTVTHRIVKIENRDVYVTKGDANPQVDSTPLPADRVQGVGRLVVPILGRLLLWARAGSLARRVLLALAALALVCLARLALDERYDPWSRPRPTTSPEIDLGVDYLTFIHAMDQVD